MWGDSIPLERDHLDFKLLACVHSGFTHVQLFATLRKDCGLPGFSDHGMLHIRLLYGRCVRGRGGGLAVNLWLSRLNKNLPQTHTIPS